MFFSYYFLLTLYLLYTIKMMLSESAEFKMAHKAAHTTYNTLDPGTAHEHMMTSDGSGGLARGRSLENEECGGQPSGSMAN